MKIELKKYICYYNLEVVIISEKEIIYIISKSNNIEQGQV